MRAPVRGIPDPGAKTRRPGQPDGQQRGAHLGLQRLAERAVLPEGEDSDQLAQAQLAQAQLAQAQLIHAAPDPAAAGNARGPGEDQEFSRCPAACPLVAYR